MESKKAALRHRQRIAHGCLAIALAVYIGAHFLSGLPWLSAALVATAEAALVGGLADWFAVSALFRRPLGLPLPHTALVPSRKDEIGLALGTFVRDKFLDPALLQEWYRTRNRALDLGQWLDSPDTANRLAEGFVDTSEALLAAFLDDRLPRFVKSLATEKIEGMNLTPVTDALLDALVKGGQHLDIADMLVASLRPLLRNHRDRIATIVGEGLGRYSPDFIDKILADRLIAGFDKWLMAVSIAGTKERRDLDSWLQSQLAAFRAAPDYRTRVSRMKASFAAHPAVRGFLEKAVEDVRRDIAADLSSPTSRIGIAVSHSIRHFGRELCRSDDMQTFVNDHLERLILDFAAPFRAEIGDYIASVVRSWDAQTVAETIELEVGRDLQFVRINGTILGGLIGLALHVTTLMLDTSP